jgi:hypothetical protein
MEDLPARLDTLLRLFAEADAKGPLDRARLVKRFRNDLQLLITEYGADAVDEALDKLPDEAWPSVLPH